MWFPLQQGPQGKGAVVPGAGVSVSHTWGFVFSAGRGDIQPQLDSALQDVNDKYLLLEETEKQAVRKALIEERGRFCTFISMLRPVIVSQSVESSRRSRVLVLLEEPFLLYLSTHHRVMGNLLCVRNRGLLITSVDHCFSASW